jgi:hypothetical protein
MAPTVPPPRRTLSPHVAPIFFLSPFRRTDRHDHLHRPGPARVRQPAGPHALAASPQGLAGAWFAGQRHARPNSPAPAPGPSPEHPLLRRRAQLLAYWGGERQSFSLPLDLSAGTAPAGRVAGAVRHSLRPRQRLRRAGAAARSAGGSAGGGGGRGPQPGVGRRALPPRAGRRRQPDRLCRRPGAQEALLRLEACPWRGAAPAQTELAWEAAR